MKKPAIVKNKQPASPPINKRKCRKQTIETVLKEYVSTGMSNVEYCMKEGGYRNYRDYFTDSELEWPNLLKHLSTDKREGTNYIELATPFISPKAIELIFKGIEKMLESAQAQTKKRKGGKPNTLPKPYIYR